MRAWATKRDALWRGYSFSHHGPSQPAFALSLLILDHTEREAQDADTDSGTLLEDFAFTQFTSTNFRVSIKPGDDPFAPSGGSQFREELGGEEEYATISEERSSQEWSNENKATVASDPPPATTPQKSEMNRRASFLRSLIPRKPRRTRSSVQLSDISSPIVSPTVPPKIAPMHSQASLMSFGDATATFTSTSGFSSRAPSPARYPSGPSSLRRTSTSRPSLSGAFDSTPSLHARTPSTAGSVRIEGHSPHPGKLRRPASAMELLPPTGSSKAFAVLGGGPKVTEENRKAVEKLTGARTSVVLPSLAAPPAPEDGDDTFFRLGLALGTDAPTRRIIPDNARNSLASFTTTTDSQSAYARSTQYSSTSGSFSRPGIDPRRPLASEQVVEKGVEEDKEGEENYDPAKEDGEAVSLYRQDPHNKAYRPLSPPPRMPLPPLPPNAVAKKKTPARRTTGDSSSSSATLKAPRAPPAPANYAPPSALVAKAPPRPVRSALRLVSPSAAQSDRQTAVPKQCQPVSSASIAALAGASSATLAPLGPTRPLASLYLVAGLPKDPAAWTLASHADNAEGPAKAPDHILDAVPRFYRPEILGLQVTGESMEKEDAAGTGMLRLGKLAFDRDVEIVASTSQPPATTSFFSFAVSPSSITPSTGLSGATTPAWESTPSLSASSSASPKVPTTYHCVSLLVWSYADAARSAAIRESVAQGARAKAVAVKKATQAAKAVAVKKATQAAKAGKRLGERLAKQMSSPMWAVREEGKASRDEKTSETEAETEGPATDTDWESGLASAALLDPLSPSLPFWLPYALVLLSPFPLYNLLADFLRLSWGRYHADIASHSLQMEKVLDAPAPRPRERVILPVSAAEDRGDTFFVATMPGSIDWSTKATLRDFPLWPIFKALHADNLLTIAELALAPHGRVLFLSRHSLMLGLATLTFQTILEMRGWRGLAHPVTHARDLRIYLEDPGPWLIGIPFASRSLAFTDIPPEVLIVDLDNNALTAARPSPGAMTTGAARDRARKKLETAIGNVGKYFGVPAELTEAFPGGRFRPFSMVEVAGQPREAERLRPEAAWDWDETRVLKAFDAILSEAPRTGLGRIFRSKRQRRPAELDKSALHAQSIVRKHANTFVDRRDMLEAKFNKANQKLAFLMAESQEWQRSFEVFRAFSEKITKESSDLKIRLERERREARRLTGQVLAEQERHTQLEASLASMEKAREQAMHELANVDEVSQHLEAQRSLLLQEIGAILASGEDESSPLFQAVYSRVEPQSHRSETPSSYRPGTSLSLRSSSGLARRPSFLSERDLVIPEDEEEHLADDHKLASISDMDEEVRLEALKLAVHETFRSISSRLSLALQTAEQFDPRSALISHASSLSSVSPYVLQPEPKDAVLPASPRSRPPPSPDMGPFNNDLTPVLHTASSSISHGFHPRPLTLTPPISPDNLYSAVETPSSFVTVRPSHRRISSRSNGVVRPAHARQSSLAAGSNLSAATDDSENTARSAASLAHTVVRQAQHSSGLVRQASYSSLQRSMSASGRSADSTDDDAQSFVSVSEGGGFGLVAGLSRPDSRASDAQGSFDLEELAWTLSGKQLQELQEQEARESQAMEASLQQSMSHSRSGSLASSIRSNGSVRRRPACGGAGGHGRQDSFGLDAPPVELFTRSMRAKRGAGGDSVDLKSSVKGIAV
ncbi:hypothetical protein JCM11641_005513 [Rhodosporidiobolus odoratus]